MLALHFRYLKQYRDLLKHENNEKYQFIVFQACLDYAVYLEDPVFERIVRWWIYVDRIEKCDEPFERNKKIRSCVSPLNSHPGLFDGHAVPFVSSPLDMGSPTGVPSCSIKLKVQSSIRRFFVRFVS